MLKSAVGAVFNIRLSVAEDILGLPPLSIINQTNLTKHYLKIILNNTPGDRMKELLATELAKENHLQGEVHHSLRQVFKFLKWKKLNYSDKISEPDTDIIESVNIPAFLTLSQDSCKYSKDMINRYIEHLWKKSIDNEFLQNGHSTLPHPTIKPLPLNRSITREVEVLSLSLLYEQNLLHSFLHRINENKFVSPLCPCGSEDQTAFHVLFRCSLVPSGLKEEAMVHLKQAVGEDHADTDNSVTLINASRHAPFMDSVVSIVTVLKDTLVSHIEL